MEFDAEGAAAVSFADAVTGAVAFAVVVVFGVVVCADVVWLVLNIPISGDDGIDELVAFAVRFPAAFAAGMASNETNAAARRNLL